MGFTGADIKNMINYSGFEAVKRKSDKIVQKDLEKAFDRILMGLSKKSIMTEYEDKLKTAYHEAGHTLMSLLVDGAMKLHKVTILPRG